MALILDYEAKAQRQPERQVAGALTLLAGAIVYAYVCQPAMHRRGYPPIDALWMGMTWVWVFPIPIFALITSSGRFSKWTLFTYAMASGFIDACTVVTLVPHRFSLTESALNFIFVGPMHLAFVAGITWLSRFLFRCLGVTVREGNRLQPKQQFLQIGIIVAILSFGAAFPFLYRHASLAQDVSKGHDLADADWAAHTTKIFARPNIAAHSFGNFFIASSLDPTTGFPIEFDRREGWEPGYNARIQELVRQQGIPAWSPQGHFVSDADLVSMLTAPDMTEVTTFPFFIMPNVVLLHGRGSGQWGHPVYTTSDAIRVEGKLGGDADLGDVYGRAYFGRLTKYPGVVFVRVGQKRVAACSDDGWVLDYTD